MIKAERSPQSYFKNGYFELTKNVFIFGLNEKQTAEERKHI